MEWREGDERREGGQRGDGGEGWEAGEGAPRPIRFVTDETSVTDGRMVSALCLPLSLPSLQPLPRACAARMGPPAASLASHTLHLATGLRMQYFHSPAPERSARLPPVVFVHVSRPCRVS